MAHITRIALVLLYTTSLLGQPVEYKNVFIEESATMKDRLIITNTDYTSVFVNSVYIDQNETFMKKNNFAINATLTVEGKDLTIPIYALRDPKVTGKLGIIHNGLLSSIPATGRPIKIATSIVRHDTDDPLKRVIDAFNGQDTQSLVKTYASTALPYISMVGAIAKQLYTTFAPSAPGDVLFALQPIEFDPTDGTTIKPFTLRDTYLLVYRSNQTLVASKLTIDKDNNVLYDDKPLTGMRWMLFGLEKSSNRQDYAGRPWQKKYEDAIGAAHRAKATHDFKEADALFQEFSVLLDADPDYTLTDRNNINTKYETAYAAIKNGANQGMDLTSLIRESTVDLTTKGPHAITISPLTLGVTHVLSVDKLLTGLAQQHLLR